MSDMVSDKSHRPARKRTVPVFDGRLFLKENFHSPQRVLAVFRTYGLASPSLSAVEKWFSRGTIPGDAFPSLLVLLELEHGKPVSIANYMIEEER